VRDSASVGCNKRSALHRGPSTHSQAIGATPFGYCILRSARVGAHPVRESIGLIADRVGSYKTPTSAADVAIGCNKRSAVHRGPSTHSQAIGAMPFGYCTLRSARVGAHPVRESISLIADRVGSYKNPTSAADVAKGCNKCSAVHRVQSMNSQSRGAMPFGYCTLHGDRTCKRCC